MSNNWSDIGNASLIVVMGANPAENHPACMAHINHARDRGGKLVVLDPRKTRTALQCDPAKGERFIRFRPGTDIAIINGITRGIMERMRTGVGVAPAVRAKYFEFLNETSANLFFPDGGTATVSVPGGSKYTDARFIMNAAGTDYVRESRVEGANTFSNFPVKAATVDADPDTVYNRLWDHVAPYTPQVVEDVSGVSPADLEFMINAYIDHSRAASVGPVTGAGSQDPRVGVAGGYRVTTMLYAMGLTQHTHGAQNVKAFAVLQSITGNVGRAGGGINALRGIHNVQGSTDMGVLAHLIPFYSGNPTQMTAGGTYTLPGTTPTNDTNAFGKYMDTLWGNTVNSGGTYDRAYVTTAMGGQQRGFANLTYNFFGDGSWMTTPNLDRTFTDGLYDLWPKTNGDLHTMMFRKMAAGTIKAAVIWGQNPAVTQANISAIRKGLRELDLLVVTDLFETETAACDRKPLGVTFLIPSCSHVEEAGSTANSGRVLQWREKAVDPIGNSKSDLELLFRLAYAFDQAGAFSHITDRWAALGRSETSVYDVVYYNRYGYKPGVSAPFESLSGTAEIWRGDDPEPHSGTVTGSEWIAERIYRELCTPATGASWLYTGAYNASSAAISGTDTREQRYFANTHVNQQAWKVFNRAKSRDTSDPNGTLAYPGWGYAWLVNRRVLYNNGDVPGDVLDFYMSPDSVSRLFVTDASRAGINLNYPRWYRFYHRLSDMPDNVGAPQSIHVTPGRFPSHTEPYETPLAQSDPKGLLPMFGRNTTMGTGFGGPGGTQWNLAPTDTRIVGKNVTDASFDLVLTTIRCVEHFQGGPITRNNPWNHEAEPEPWIELNSVDANRWGIRSGDYVNVITARGESTQASQGLLSPNAGTFAKGFVARVGVGTADNQRVGPGVVAIPWHWGERGLSRGSRANDLTVDAGDANTTIPEYKACLCKIRKIET